MLVLSRYKHQEIICPELNIRIVVSDVTGERVRIGILAPEEFKFLRLELLNRIEAEQGKPLTKPIMTELAPEPSASEPLSFSAEGSAGSPPAARQPIITPEPVRIWSKKKGDSNG